MELCNTSEQPAPLIGGVERAMTGDRRPSPLVEGQQREQPPSNQGPASAYGESSSPEFHAVKELLSETFCLEASFFSDSAILSAIQERMKANRLPSLNTYFHEVESNSGEQCSLLRHVLSSPGWGHDLIGAGQFESFLDFTQRVNASGSGDETRIWFLRTGLGFNVVNFLITYEKMLELQKRDGHSSNKYRKLKQHYKIYATDMDFEIVRLAKKLTFPESSQACFHFDSTESPFVSYSDGSFRLQSQLRQKIHFAIYNHLSHNSLGRMDWLVLHDLSGPLSDQGLQALVANLVQATKPGACIFCADDRLSRALSSHSSFQMQTPDGRCFLRSFIELPNLSEKTQVREESRPAENSNRKTQVSDHSQRLDEERTGSENSSASAVEKLLKMKDDYIDVLHGEIDDLYSQIQDLTEELSTSLEELETVNEELRISNGQLSTVNEEYSRKLDEISQYLKDYDRITEHLNIALLFIDRDQSIRFFNSRFEAVYGLCSKDMNRLVTDFIFVQNLKLLEAHSKVLESGEEFRYVIDCSAHRRRTVRALPYEVHHIGCHGVLFCIQEEYTNEVSSLT